MSGQDEAIRLRRGGRIVVLPPEGHGSAWRGDGTGRPSSPVKKPEALPDLVLIEGTLRGFA